MKLYALHILLAGLFLIGCDPDSDSATTTVTDTGECDDRDTGPLDDWPLPPEDTSTVDSCNVPVPGWFESQEEEECGLSTNECGSWCRWTLALYEDGTYERSYSDHGDSGSWLCDGEIMTFTPASLSEYEGLYDPGSGHLIVDEVGHVFASSSPSR